MRKILSEGLLALLLGAAIAFFAFTAARALEATNQYEYRVGKPVIIDSAYFCGSEDAANAFADNIVKLGLPAAIRTPEFRQQEIDGLCHLSGSLIVMIVHNDIRGKLNNLNGIPSELIVKVLEVSTQPSQTDETTLWIVTLRPVIGQEEGSVSTTPRPMPVFERLVYGE